MRWDDYVMDVGEPADPLSLCSSARSITRNRTMYLLGVGFDPRCLVGLKEFLALDGGNEPLIVRIELPQQISETLETRALAEVNALEFEELASDHEVSVIPFLEVHDRVNAGPILARSVVGKIKEHDVGHVVIDISSLPSTLSFPLVAAVLRASDARDSSPEHFAGEFQVVACENPYIDASIRELGVSEAGLVGGFRHLLEMDSQPTSTTIWAPVIGEACGPALQAIHSFLGPEDTCPVLPFPARDPRRSDSLLLEHQREIFEEFQVTPSNVIYADESNPFDLYRTLSRMQEDYIHALAPLAPVTIVLSSHSSKLLSLGVLLAAYEHDLPVAAAPCEGYMIEGSADLSELAEQNRLSCVWLAGTPYK